MLDLIADGNNPASAWYHEAGHAVATVLTAPEVELVYAEILPAGEGRFQVRRLLSPAGAGAYGLVLCAGRAAELLAGQDPQRAVEASADDDGRIEGLLDELGLTGARRAEQVARWRSRAEGLLLTEWTAVEYVARALRRCRRLTGDDVATIVGRYRRQEATR